MKKNLKLIVFTIVLCAVSILNVKVMLDIDYSNDLLMTSLVSVSRGEGDPDGGDDDGTCRTDITGDMSIQDCRGVKKNGRATITYKCEGKGLGLCDDGVEYYFYDCEGAMIKHDEYIDKNFIRSNSGSSLFRASNNTRRLNDNQLISRLKYFQFISLYSLRFSISSINI